jgi:lia operon protein LiaG
MTWIRKPSSPARIARIGALFLALQALPPVARADEPAQYELPGREIAVFNLIGEARVIPGSGSEVLVDVAVGGRDAAKISVQTGVIDGRQTLRVVYDANHLVYPELGAGSNTQISVHKDGTFGEKLGGRKVRISGKGSGVEARADLTIYVPSGKSVRVHQAVGEVSARGVTGEVLLHTAAAPVAAEEIRGSLKVDVGSGSVTVRGVDGDVAIDTGSGDVNVQDLRGLHIGIDTGSGQVTGDGIVAPDLAVDTGSGDIELTGVQAKRVALDTGSGAVGIELREDVDRVAIDTGSGDVRVGVPASLGAEVRIESGSGDIDIGVPHETEKAERSFFSGRIGDGQGRIHVDTGSGAVSITGV